MLEVGTTAPGFAVSDQDGQVVTLESLRGHWVALWWYPLASTPVERSRVVGSVTEPRTMNQPMR